MNSKQSHLAYAAVSGKSRNIRIPKLYNGVKNNGKKFDFLSVIYNPIVAFIVSPILAYKFFFDLMPMVLLFSTFFALIMFSVSFFFVLISFFGSLNIMKNGSVFFFNILLHRRIV